MSLVAAPSPLQPRSPSLANIQNSRSPASKPRLQTQAQISPAKRALPLRKSSQVQDEPPAKRAKTTISQSNSSSSSSSSNNGSSRDAASATADIDFAELRNLDIEARYTKGQVLGEGTYAIVYKATLRSDPSQLFAIKKFKINKENSRDGINVDTIREIKYLQELQHPNIVALHDVFSSKDQNINMVIDFLSGGTLEDIIRARSITYTLPDIKAWTVMLTRAIYFCHQHFVLHRDIKPGNLLLSASGQLKLADFGLARSFAPPDHNMTSMVVTLWYRAPELLFGAKHYSGAIDVWATGMILAELVVRRPWCAYAPESEDQLERGGGELGQLEKIAEALGAPSEENWPGVTSLPHYIELSTHSKVAARTRTFFKQQFGTLDDEGIDLIMKMLSLDPRKRITAKGILGHSWWLSQPPPTPLGKLPKSGAGAEAVAQKEVEKPGVIEKDKRARFEGVARKLDFGQKR